MKPKTFMKRLSTTFLATTMVASSFSQFSIPVFAQEATSELPIDLFATAEQLKSFNTISNDDIPAAKVYFGKDRQQWWIAGSQENKEMTLFSASTLEKDQQFEPKWNAEKNYSPDWGCNYDSDPSEVNPNHYGASPLRTTLKGLENSYFTEDERDLMKDTTIYTNDTKNNIVYSTTDKLYLPYGEYDAKYITVGENGHDNLNAGLRIDNDYWANSDYFWLRTASTWDKRSAWMARPGYSVTEGYVNSRSKLVPAFKLDLSTVLFASAAPRALDTGDLKVQDTDVHGAFTLRYDASKYNENLGSALVSYDKSKVTLKDNASSNAFFLVVQNSEGAKAKRIAQIKNNVVSAREMGLNSFDNCKVWLERSRMEGERIYATLATEEQGHDVNIRTEAGLTITSNNGVQAVVQGNTIADITVEVTDGYYLPEDYINNLQGQMGGLTVTKTDSGFTISGTPTSDVNIQLPAATPKPVSGSGSNGGGSTVKLNPVYRAYNPNNGEHLYTLDEKEYKHVASLGWDAEGVAFMAEEEKNGQALYRVYNPNSGLHHYTLDENEKNTLVSLGWHDEKVAWYTSKKPQSAPVYRVYNPNDGNHHYTMNQQEKDVLVSLGWQDEGLAFRTAPIEK